ncbi:unnamed protein product [Adineta ricciae]|nr:unnamed protein product [Adineta ricciae]
MTFLIPPHDITRLWLYCIGGVATVIFLMVTVCYFACRQEYTDRAERRKAKERHLVTVQQWQQQVNSFPDLSRRPASDILMELNVGQHRPNPQVA